MKKIRFSPDLYKKLQQLRTKDNKLFQQVYKKLRVFELDPRHPSLRLHKITRDIENVWSISINMSIRMLYAESEEDYYFFEIGTHNEIYRK